jgi:hypothetical protein
MPIQPLSNRPREISVTEPIEPAYDRVKRMLFKPFNFGRWITIGFCAWLAGLGEAGSGGSFNSSNPAFHNHREQATEQVRHFYHLATNFVLGNLSWIVPLAVFLVLALLAFGLLVLWLNCRGKFMFLHCVALDKAEVDAPWRQFADAGNSLFWFRLGLGLMGAVVTLPLLALIGLDIFQMVTRGGPNVAGVMLAVALGFVFLLFAIVFALIQKFLADFVVPIMFLRGGNCLAGWREFWGLLSAHPGQFTLYILFQIVLGIAIGIIVSMAVLVTCCIAGCLLALPFLGTVFFLPVLIFKRAYSLYFLAQFGPQYDVFPPAPAAPVSPTQWPLQPVQ